MLLILFLFLFLFLLLLFSSCSDKSCCLVLWRASPKLVGEGLVPLYVGMLIIIIIITIIIIIIHTYIFYSAIPRWASSRRLAEEWLMLTEEWYWAVALLRLNIEHWTLNIEKSKLPNACSPTRLVSFQCCSFWRSWALSAAWSRPSGRKFRSWSSMTARKPVDSALRILPTASFWPPSELIRDLKHAD